MGGSFEGKIIIKHTFLEVVQCPSQSRRRSATEGAIADIKECVEYAEEKLDGQFNCGSWSTVATNASYDTEVDMSPEHTLVHACLNQENAELRAFQENITHEQTTSAQNCDIQLPLLQSGAHADRQGVAVVMVPMVDFSTGCPQLIFQTQQHFDQFACGQQHGVAKGSDPSDNASPSSTHDYSTVMLRNLPNMYTRSMLVDLLNSEGFEGKFTFLYLPIDFKSHAGLGYAFVDMESPAEAERLRQHFEGFSNWTLVSEKVCSVSWSLPDQQGFDAHVERYRNSPVMHKSVPDEWKPILLSGGERIRFPPATRKIRAPRIRPGV